MCGRSPWGKYGNTLRCLETKWWGAEVAAVAVAVVVAVAVEVAVGVAVEVEVVVG